MERYWGAPGQINDKVMQQKARAIRRRTYIFAAMLLVVCAGTWLAYSVFLDATLDFYEAFQLSKPELEAYAAKVTSGDVTVLTNPPKRLGQFHVLKVESLPHGFLFQHNSGNPLDWCGIAYSTETLAREEKDVNGDVRQYNNPLGENWYDVWRPSQQTSAA